MTQPHAQVDMALKGPKHAWEPTEFDPGGGLKQASVPCAFSQPKFQHEQSHHQQPIKHRSQIEIMTQPRAQENSVLKGTKHASEPIEFDPKGRLKQDSLPCTFSQPQTSPRATKNIKNQPKIVQNQTKIKPKSGQSRSKIGLGADFASGAVFGPILMPF